MLNEKTGDSVKRATDEETEKLYAQLLSSTRNLLTDYTCIDIKIISKQIEKIIEQLILGNAKLLMLALISNATDENYLLCHSVNVCIYSIQMGIALGYERPKLIELGVAAFLHDIGLVKYLSIVNQPRKLTSEEHEEVKKHSLIGKQILEKFNGLAAIAAKIAEQHHERKDGSGYPQGLKAETIDEYARIVGLVDKYESMTHKRLYRGSYTSLETVTELTNNKDKFEYKLIKILIEKIGVYPLGSFVKLSTKEIAQVVKLNPRFPLRPVVQIIYNTEGRKLKEARMFDMSTQPPVYITGGIEKEELN